MRKENDTNLAEENVQLRLESDYLNRVHEEAISNFEKKFELIQREVNHLTAENQLLKQNDQHLKRRMNELDVDNIEWREKTKYFEQKTAMSQAAFEIQAQNASEKVFVQKGLNLMHQDAFSDIKALIGNYKRDREQQRAAPNSDGKLNASFGQQFY